MKIKLPVRKPGPPLKRPPQLKLKASVARSRRAPVIEEEDFLEEPEPNMRLSHAFVVVLVLHVIAVAGVFAFNSIKAKQADIFSAIKDEPAKSASTDAAASAPETINESNPVTPPTPISPMPNPANGPAPIQPASANSTASAPSMSSAGAAKTHEMQPGETLTKVAVEYGVSIGDLEKANNIADPTKIRAGTVLTIPEASSAPAPVAVKPAAVAKAPEPIKPAAQATGDLKDSGKVYVVVKGDNPVKIAKRLKVSYAGLLSLNGITDPRKLQIGQKLKVPAAAK